MSAPKSPVVVLFLLLAGFALLAQARNLLGQRDRNEYVIDIEKTSDPEGLMKQIKDLALAIDKCNSEFTTKMKLHLLQNATVTCNDGSPAGYYLRKSVGSRRWVVFLEGGYYCWDRMSCAGRWQTDLMTSTQWSQEKTGSGILSAYPEENPHWWNANAVYIPYCSSDVWSGQKGPSQEGGGMSFMGAFILREAIKELLGHGLIDASTLLLAGSSAGGTGVLLNVDSVADMLRNAGSRAKVRGLVDSGWFLDMTNTTLQNNRDCINPALCSPSSTIIHGIRAWKSLIPNECLERYPTETWKCFFGYLIYPTIKTPVFIFQWLYDEAQLAADIRGPPVRLEHWSYMKDLSHNIRKSLRNISAVFAPSCYSHTIITERNWQCIQIREFALPDVLECWLLKSEETEKKEKESKNKKGRKGSSGNYDVMQADEWGEPTRSISESGRKGGKGNNKDKTRQRGGKRKNRRKQRDVASHLSSQHHCHQHLIDHAPCPHCNPTCPKLQHPFTGEKIEFLTFLRVIGLDLNMIASELGIDLTDSSQMDLSMLQGQQRK